MFSNGYMLLHIKGFQEHYLTVHTHTVLGYKSFVSYNVEHFIVSQKLKENAVIVLKQQILDVHLTGW
jgi:hypothetical protein